MNKIENNASKTRNELNKYKDWCQKAKIELDKMIQGNSGEEFQVLAEEFKNANLKATESMELLNLSLRAMREMSNAILQTMELK